jgi:hypothetical protein
MVNCKKIVFGEKGGGTSDGNLKKKLLSGEKSEGEKTRFIVPSRWRLGGSIPFSLNIHMYVFIFFKNLLCFLRENSSGKPPKIKHLKKYCWRGKRETKKTAR